MLHPVIAGKSQTSYEWCESYCVSWAV